jgi:TRAP-type uncharacterized transport system substrate-binding protein
MLKESKTGRNFIPGISNRRFLVVITPVLLTALISIVIAYHLTPQDTLTLSTGFERGTYAKFGERYKEILAREKVRLELFPSSGSVENLRRLGNPSLRVYAGFVQDGTSSPSETKNLVSLGAICYSPLWVFYRIKKLGSGITNFLFFAPNVI